ncbi:hypothetical protein Y032_0154g3013 [Ancylostoma ceylanicum]|uniref:Peptidase C1A papain C-terminal domain-containing protein n=1 Tax=Ancylostoma ceylanicum TaxID=53326 RepID=A0A016T0B8_9BILA|nr:hypothetical protein Y032_0154g3013 [Ancylostoma ceylanicum]
MDISGFFLFAHSDFSFDARTQWPECRSIGTIRDQSACGSCWAVSSAEAMSDEICVQSNSTIKVHHSY